MAGCACWRRVALFPSPEKVAELLGRRRRWWWCSWGMLLIVGDDASNSREGERESFGSATDSREREKKNESGEGE